jgi:regulator of cell morphogenesis and NO signaling
MADAATRTTADPAPRPGPAAALVDTILATHHELARELAGRLDTLAPAVAAAGLAGDARLAEVADTCALLAREMLSHLQREETVLFPVIRELEAEGADEGDVGLLFSPIVCMKREHNSIDDLFARLRTLTDGYVAPAGASPDHRALLAVLGDFERDTIEHVRKENDELFPMASDLVPPVR